MAPISLRLAVGGNRSQRRWLRLWWLGAVLAACLAWSASAQAQPFVYVTNAASNSVSQYDATGGALTPLAPPTVPTGNQPIGVAVSPDGKSVYVVNQSDDTVSQYDIGVAGALTLKTPATVSTGSGPVFVAITPDGKSVYVTNRGGTVSQYDVGSGGALTPKTPTMVSTGGSGLAPTVAVSPDGKSAYVSNGGASTVSQYDIGLSGVLTPKTPATVAAGPPGQGFGASGVAVTPDGKSVYVANALNGGPGPGLVFQFDVGTGGALTPKPSPDAPASAGPLGVAVSPNGKSVYVANAFSTGVSQYDVGMGGALTPKTPAFVGTGVGPMELAINPDGKSVYVPNFDDATVAQLDVDPLTGVLSPKTPATVASRPGPEGIAVTPLPRVHATATSVSCSPSGFAPGDATVCTATVTDTASSGQRTPTGTASFTNSGDGRFFGSPCTLSGSGASASCAVFFTGFAPGGRIIGAGYGGDATHSASSAFTGVTVVVPESTAGCVVFGHGRITAANGDKASFRGLVAATPPRGVEFYRDNGPANAMRVVSTSIDALSCADDATKASVFGTARINGAGSVEYRINVQLTAWEWGKDTYRIRLSNGYDSGAQPIRHGDLNIHLRDRDHQHHDANANHYKPGAGQDGG